MNKFQKIKQAIQNTPPERLAKIEYQSHFLQMIGISVVCIFLLTQGFWYIIFAFIFGLGISYSQGISAYRKYKNIIAIVGEEKPKDFEKDISLTRRRSKIIRFALGGKAKWISIVLAIVLTVATISPYYNRWILMATYPITISVYFFLIYFFVCYWISYPIYKKRIKKEVKKK